MRPDGTPRLRLHPGAQPPDEYGEIEVPEEVQMDEGDECCEEARMQWREAMRAAFGKESWDDIEIIISGPCEETQQELERWIEQDWSKIQPASLQDVTLQEAMVRIRNEWDACSSKSHGGDMGFYASAEALEEGWNHIAKNEPSLRERINDILLPDDDTMPDVATLQTDMGNDPCCGEAREMWRDGLIDGWGVGSYANDPDGGLRILEMYDAMSCEEFRQSLENRFDAQGYSLMGGGGSKTRSLTRPGMNPNSPRSNHSWEDWLANRVLEAWDKCAEARIPATPEGDMGGEDMGFYASADPFEVAWDIVQEQIGREDFTYGMAIQPHLMSNMFGNLPPELGLRVGGQIPIKDAIRHLENSQSLEDFARTKGWQSAEDVGLRLEDFDDEWEFYERAAEQGVGYPPEDHLQDEYQYFRPHQAQQMARRRDGGITDAEILRVNMEGMGHPNEYREAFPPVARETMLEGLDQRLEAGANKAPVSTGSISALGQGPMVDVNPAFAGMGLGYSTLAALLENTGTLSENYLSPGGLATLQGLGRKLDEAGINHNLSIAPTVPRPVMDAEQQLRNWQESDARYPNQGQVQMSIDDGTQLTHQGTPNKVGYITHSINQQLDNEPPSTVEELKAMLDYSKRMRTRYGALPPSLNKFPVFTAPSWQDRISWGE